MKTFIFLLVTLAIGASSGVNGQVKPYFISVYEEGEILPVPTECPKVQNPDVTVHIAHETDCTKFYTCSFGKPYIKDCPSGLHFNPRKQVCDNPASAGCVPNGSGGSSTSTEKPTPKPTPPTTEATTPSTEKPTPPTTEATTPSTEKPTPKPTPPTTEATTPSTEKPTPKPTPPTTEATTPSTEKPTPKPTPPTTEATTPSTEKPTPKPTPPTTEATTPSYPTSCPEVDPEEAIVLPHECVCAKYYTCRKGEQILTPCSIGLHFNPTSHKCDLPQNAGCVSTPAPTTPIPIIPGECPAVNGDDQEAVHLPHETKCSLFYKCDNGKKALFECPDNLHYNPEKQVCDWPNPKMCKDKSYF